MSTWEVETVEQLRSRAEELAVATVERHYARVPGLAARYGAAGRARCLEDAGYHLRYLAEAVEARSPILFSDYVEWTRVVLEERDVSTDDLITNFECLRETFDERLSPAQAAEISDVLNAGLTQLRRERCDPEPEPRGAAQELAKEYLSLLLAGERARAVQLIRDAVAGGMTVRDIYLHVFQPVQYEIGRLWQVNRITVAQEHYCTAVTQLAMSQLYPELLSHPPCGRVLVCACIGGDLHEIGSRMIADFFELEGWDTYYLGASTPVPGIVEQVQNRKADLLALSATMTYHLAQMRECVAAVRAEGGVRILVGGRPFLLDAELWRSVGADGWAKNADEAVAVAREWFGEEQA